MNPTSTLILRDAPPPLPEGARRIGLMADTHDCLLPSLWGALAGCERVLHAGDICRPGTLAALQAALPGFAAVHGNCDPPEVANEAPASRVEEFDFGAIAMTHSHLLPGGDRHRELAAQFARVPRLRVIVYGHTHVPALARTAAGVWIVNPGSAGQHRVNDAESVALLDRAPGTNQISIAHVRLSRP